MNTTRREVYAAIDSERAYQDAKWGDVLSSGRKPGQNENGGERTLDEFTLYIVGYAHKLLDQASTFADPRAKLDGIRKIAGLCVAAMEEHGAPGREIAERPGTWTACDKSAFYGSVGI